MRVGQSKDFVEFEHLETVPAHLPTPGDVRLGVTLRLGTFHGSYEHVWIDLRELKRFIEDLVSLERNRHGSAGVSSMTPDEFSFEIRSFDQLGHMVVETHLRRYRYSPGGKPRLIGLEGCFEVDPYALKELLWYFEGLTRRWD